MIRPDRRSPARPRPSTSHKIASAKALIAAASVAATVGGWAQLAHNNEVASATQPSSLQTALQAGQHPEGTGLQLDALSLPTVPPLPTIVPAPDFSKLALGAAEAPGQVALVVPTIAPPPTPIPPQPTPQPKAAPSLRQVTVPQPAPRAVTHSSR